MQNNLHELFEKDLHECRPLVALADAFPGHLLLLDLNEKIIFANKAMLDLWKISRQEVTGKPMKEIIGENAYQVLHTYTLEVLSDQSLEYTAPFLIDGQVHYFQNTYTPYKNSVGKILGFIATGIDVTKMAELEEQLKALKER